jgi:hypothetical protein
MFVISGNTALITRDAKIVLTCRPRSEARPTGSICGTYFGTARQRDALDAGAVSPGSTLTLEKAHDDAAGAEAATWTQHGAAAPATESASLRVED